MMVGSIAGSTGASESGAGWVTVVVAVGDPVTVVVEAGESEAVSSVPHPDARSMSVPAAATNSFIPDLAVYVTLNPPLIEPLRPSRKATARSRGGGSCAACHGMRVAGVLVDRMGCSDDEVLDGSVCAGATCVLPGDACGNVGNRKRYRLPVTEC